MLRRLRNVLVSGAILLGLSSGVLAVQTVQAPIAHANMPVSGTAAQVGSATSKYLIAHRPDNFRGRAFLVAMAQRGDMYLYGAAGPNRFDCSGLQVYSYTRVGVRLPRTSTAQRNYTRRVSWADARAGDLLFFSGHVGMYAGKRNGYRYMVHSSRSRQPVKLVRLSSYYYNRLIKIGRVPYRPL